MKTKMHFADNCLINPTNPITVNLIGAGGTGSQTLTALARMNHSLLALGHTGLQVSLYDDDVVTTANQGRQLFADCEVGLNKAVALINRTNRFFGTNWKAVTKPFTGNGIDALPERGRANIYITCVDTAAARFDIAKALETLATDGRAQRDKPLYWLDLGNSKNTGQAVLATISFIKQPNSERYEPVADLPFVTKEFKTALEVQDDSNEPSCSLAEALEKQDLFINSTIANMAASLLWNLFREGMTDTRGFFMNLKNFSSTSIKVG
ncbi:PRTRC system ThiF family protein [Flavobacterium sp. Sd200]|uniref:PRTRC system ThiF family protein n=1 Tax=Flavobacterium sp. Sd200 TaxID=2692211 RepID=UPI00136D4B2A|nr:PRTRC system ThiF family protein [Flavobacterium sp. Sd200]MXN91110.1 PRTRC system ThiF family protein [Flavobacterium sp. Sd200]